MNRFGGFPPLYGDHWQPKLSLEKLLATIHLDFNVEPLFELKVAADDMNNSQHIILVKEKSFHSFFFFMLKKNFSHFKLNHPSLFLQASAAYESQEEIDAYLTFMISVSTTLGVERTRAKTEMQQILDLETELANVGETFIYFTFESLNTNEDLLDECTSMSI